MNFDRARDEAGTHPPGGMEPAGRTLVPAAPTPPQADGTAQAYLGPYPNLAHRTEAEIAARTVSAADWDVLAYLGRKRANAATIEANSAAGPEQQARATIVRQTIDVLIGDLRAGLHHGEGA